MQHPGGIHGVDDAHAGNEDIDEIDAVPHLPGKQANTMRAFAHVR